MDQIKTSTGYDDLNEREFLIEWLNQINKELDIFRQVYYETQFDPDTEPLRKMTYENIKLVTKQKKEFIARLKKDFDYDVKD